MFSSPITGKQQMPMNCTSVGQKVIFESSLCFVAGSGIGDRSCRVSVYQKYRETIITYREIMDVKKGRYTLFTTLDTQFDIQQLCSKRLCFRADVFSWSSCFFKRTCFQKKTCFQARFQKPTYTSNLQGPVLRLYSFFL